jgi:hypothetical protein
VGRVSGGHIDIDDILRFFSKHTRYLGIDTGDMVSGAGLPGEFLVFIAHRLYNDIIQPEKARDLFLLNDAAATDNADSKLIRYD